VGIGLLTGRRALKDERERALAQRRQQAKQAVRRYLDDVSAAVAKDQRDATRRAQRLLRDDSQRRAESLQRTLNEASSRVEASAKGTRAARTARRQDLEAELARLQTLAQRAGTLVGRAAT
jgi:hypothetical protein